MAEERRRQGVGDLRSSGENGAEAHGSEASDKAVPEIEHTPATIVCSPAACIQYKWQ